MGSFCVVVIRFWNDIKYKGNANLLENKEK